MTTVCNNESIQSFQRSKYELFRSKDIDEARCRVGEVYCDHKLTTTKGMVDAFHYHIPFDGMSLNYMGYGAESNIEPGCLGDFYLIQLPIKGEAKIQVDGRLIESNPQKASLLNPNVYTSMTWGENCEQMLVQIAKEKVHSVLNNCIGTHISGAICFDPVLELNNQQHATWWRHLISFITEYNREYSFYNNSNILSTELDNIIKGLLYSLDHNHSELLHSGSSSVLPRHVKKATNYMRDNAAKHVTMKDLVRLTGVSESSLFEGFKNNLHLTPMQFLLQTRLTNARAQLLNQSPDRALSVTEIALNNGFSQLGRFSSTYRKVFGELPSETLKNNQ